MKDRQRFEKQDFSSIVPLLCFSAMVLFGLAVVLLYVCLAEPQPGTAMGAIRDVARGLGGSMCFVFPLALVWFGVLCVAAARENRAPTLIVVCDALLIVCLFAAVHVFFAERIIRERMTIPGFTNFVAKSYGFSMGGGAIGALLAWPLYRYLGVVSGFITTLLMMALLLTASGRTSRLVRWIRHRSKTREPWEDTKNEHSFDQQPNTRSQFARRSRSRDPYKDTLFGDPVMPVEARLRKSARPARGVAPLEGSARPAEATKQNNVCIDDLKIEPDAYEMPDEDVAPFDVPAPKKDISSHIIEPTPIYNYPPIELLRKGEDGTIGLRDVLENREVSADSSCTEIGLGVSKRGKPFFVDIAYMPHLLIGGQTGSGKSVCINVIILSLLFHASPEDVKMILIDPKAVELYVYNDIPHLICPVITEPKKAAVALDWVVNEMTTRYKKFTELGVRNINSYNRINDDNLTPLPILVVFIEDLSDLMAISPKETENCICRITQMGNNAGIHLIVSTNHASAKVITSAIRENIPARISFSTVSSIESRMIINVPGAENLLRKGEMLVKIYGYDAPQSVQGAWVSDEEVHAIVDYIKQSGEACYDPDMLEHLENAMRSDAEKEEVESEYDPKLAEAVDIALEMGQTSISMLQRRMRIGYARTGRLIDEMTRLGIISEADGAKPRVVLISREQAQQMFEE